MSKTTDDKLERVQTMTVEGPTGATEIVEPAPRMRRIPATVDDAGMAIVTRAVTLKLARMACLEPDSHELYGKAIVSILTEWLGQEMA